MGARVGHLWIASTLYLASCLTAQLTPCGELLCPSNALCLDGERCATREQIAVCDGLADGELCRSSFGDGRCVAGVCTPNVCGDGEVTGNEDCDGQAVPITCEDLGYYSGIPTCTSYCAIDRGGCAERCGDGVIQADREDCDGGPPSTSCVDYGRDYGVLGCSTACAPDISNDCRRYGWPVLLQTDEDLAAAAANAHGAIGIATASVFVAWDGVTSSRPQSGWTRAAASSAAFYAVGDTSLSWFDANGWHDLALAAGPGVLAATESGILYVVQPSCAVTRIDAAAAAIASAPTAPGSACVAAITIGETLYVADEVAGLLRWDGAWEVVLATPLAALAVGSPGRIVAGTTATGKLEVDITVTPAITRPIGGVWIPNQIQIAVDVDGDELDMAIDETGAAYARTDNLGGTVSTVVGTRKIGRSADGRIISWGRSVHRFDPQPATISTFNAGDNIRIELLADGAVTYFGSKNGWLDATGLGGTRPWDSGAQGTCVGIIGDIRDDHLAVSTAGAFRWSPSTGAYIQEASVYFSDAAGDLSNAFALNSGTLYRRSGTTWSPLVLAGCFIHGLVGHGEVYAVGECASSGSVLRWNGAVFTPIASWPYSLHEPTTAFDGTVFMLSNNAQLLVLDGTTLTPLPDTGWVAAISRDERYTSKQSEWVHVNGSVTSDVRMPVGRALATPRVFVVYDVVLHQMRMLQRMPSQHGVDNL